MSPAHSQREATRAVLDTRGTGHYAIRYIERRDPLHDNRPGSIVPLFVPGGAGGLKVARLEWGFLLDGESSALFNTRIETTLEQLHLGRRGMRAKAIAESRCLKPVRAFYESRATERVPSQTTGKSVKRQYLFRLSRARAFLLAAVQPDGLSSIVTAASSASVAPAHDRMQLVLGPGESAE